MYEGEGVNVGRWVLYIGVLVLLNVLSYAFDWPFWIY